MRHGRAKAARKTLRYFERTVNLQSKPYYSVLLDATFLIAMIRMTSSTSSNNDETGTLVARIERVLQVNGGGTYFQGSRDDRLSGFGDNPSHSNNSSHNNNNSNRQTVGSNPGGGPSSGTTPFARYSVRYFVPQEALDELETIVQTFRERASNTKKAKKQRQYAEKSRVFEDALAWIKSNSGGGSKQRQRSNNNSHHRGRCEVLPSLETVAAPSSEKKPNKASETTNDDKNETNNSTISASDAIRRHIARDDGREDPETNATTNTTETPIHRTYIVASQEEDLLDDLRKLGTVPILRCTNNASVLILEQPSKSGQKTDKRTEAQKWRGALQNPSEKALVDAAWEVQKRRDRANNILGQAPAKRGQLQKAKGPNPLSCKKRKAQREDPQSNGESKSQKRRARAKRNKVASEAKE